MKYSVAHLLYGKQKDISTPIGESFSLPFPILKTAKYFKAIFDISSRKVTPTNIYYLDSAYVGTETGSESQPFNDLKSAIDAANVAGQPAEFRVKGYFDRLRSFGISNNPTVPCNWVSWDGAKYVFSAEDRDGATYTARGGAHPDVYYRTRSVTDFVTQYVDLGARGFPRALAEVGSLNDCQATEGSFFKDGNVVNIHAFGHQDLSASDAGVHTVLLVNGLSLRPSGSQQFYVEDLQCIGFQSGFIEVNGTSGNSGKVTLNRVEGKYGSVTNGFVMNDCADIMSFDCYSGYSYRDGFNYHNNDGIVGMYAVEADCVSEYAGREGGDSQNASSAHDGITIMRLNGEYSYAAGRNIHDIGTGTTSVNYGTYVHSSRAATTSGSVNYVAGDGTDDTVMFLSDCAGAGSLVMLKASTGATIYVDNELVSNPSNVEDGTITLKHF